MPTAPHSVNTQKPWTPTVISTPDSDTPIQLSRRSDQQRSNAIRDLLQLVEDPSILSFAGGLPDANLFPQEQIAALSQDVLATEANTVLQYGMTAGRQDLRERIAKLMQDRMGVECTVENILITTGSQQAIDLATRCLHNPGDRIAVENPTYLGALQTFRAADAEMVTFEDAAVTPLSGQSRLALGYLIPDFCNPTGRTLTRAQRQSHLDAASQGGYVLIEDSAYAELRYSGDQIPSLLAMDTTARGTIEDTRVIQCGTFSKTLIPGFRVGWACGPSHLIAKMIRMKECADILTPPLMQSVTLRLLDTLYDDHINVLRTAYGTRRDAMMKALSKYMPEGVTWTKPNGGMFTWVTLPEKMDADLLLKEAIEKAKIAYVPGCHFTVDQSMRNTLRMSFCLYEPETLDQGMSRFGAFLAKEMSLAQ
ncbi:MAG: PLP-dependent aminotransferase family protein [Paracoccaceae bacterium]